MTRAQTKYCHHSAQTPGQVRKRMTRGDVRVLVRACRAPPIPTPVQIYVLTQLSTSINGTLPSPSTHTEPGGPGSAGDVRESAGSPASPDYVAKCP